MNVAAKNLIPGGMMAVDRYLSICAWARKRYTRAGRLVISIGGAPQAYKRIECAAWDRYMDGPERRAELQAERLAEWRADDREAAELERAA